MGHFPDLPVLDFLMAFSLQGILLFCTFCFPRFHVGEREREERKQNPFSFFALPGKFQLLTKRGKKKKIGFYHRRMKLQQLKGTIISDVCPQRNEVFSAPL